MSRYARADRLRLKEAVLKLEQKMKDVDPGSTALVVIDVQRAFLDWEKTGAGRKA
jgi:hypothetical protein